MSVIQKWIEVNAPVAEVFNLFSDFGRMPQWMHGVTEVRPVGGNRTRWTLAGSSSSTALQWETKTIIFNPARRLAWRGAGGDVEASGDVTFEETKRGTTLLCVQLGYEPSGGPSGSLAIARLLDEDLARHLEKDLQLFKSIAENFEKIERSGVGQPHAASVGLYPPTMPASKQVDPARVNDDVRRHDLEAGQFDTPEDAANTMLPQAPRGGAITKQQEEINTEAGQPLPQYVGVYRDNSSETIPIRPSDAPASRAVNNDESVSPSTFQPEAGILQDDAPTIVAARRPTPSLDTRPLAQTAAGRRELAQGHARRSPRPLYVMLGIALAVGLSLLWYALQREPNNPPAVSSSNPPPAEMTAPEPTPTVSDSAAAATQIKSTTDGNTPVVERNADRAARAGAPTEDEPQTKATERQQLRAQLSSWIAATNARDVEEQMSFYGPVVQRYYLTSYVPRERVRADKSRLFAKARSVDIATGDPEVTFDNRGTVATMRFRKQYDIENNERSRRGEVLQELKWLKTDKEGWKIISERDLRVIR